MNTTRNSAPEESSSLPTTVSGDQKQPGLATSTQLLDYGEVLLAYIETELPRFDPIAKNSPWRSVDPLSSLTPEERIDWLCRLHQWRLHIECSQQEETLTQMYNAQFGEDNLLPIGVKSIEQVGDGCAPDGMRVHPASLLPSDTIARACIDFWLRLPRRLFAIRGSAANDLGISEPPPPPVPLPTNGVSPGTMEEPSRTPTEARNAVYDRRSSKPNQLPLWFQNEGCVRQRRNLVDKILTTSGLLSPSKEPQRPSIEQSKTMTVCCTSIDGCAPWAYLPPQFNINNHDARSHSPYLVSFDCERSSLHRIEAPAIKLTSLLPSSLAFLISLLSSIARTDPHFDTINQLILCLQGTPISTLCSCFHPFTILI